MAVTQTKAASFIQEHTEEISSHKIISLLMEGAIERVDQSLSAHENNQIDDLELLTQKLIAILNGLRNSLNMEAGGEIAQNLDALYEYMVMQITQASFEGLKDAFFEVRSLLLEVKDGWDKMDLSQLDSPAFA